MSDGTRRMDVVGTALSTCVLVMYLFAPAVYGLPPEHSPFFPEERYRVALPACTTARTVASIHPPEATVTFRGDASPVLELSIADFAYTARIGTPGHTPREQIGVPVAVTTPDDVLEPAVCADLDGDGRMDFAVTLWLHGNGLGAAYHRLLIVLSGDAGYRFWLVSTMWPSADDFVALDGTAPIALVTTEWVTTGGDAPRSYLVYALWTFRDGAVVPANEIDDRFPKWVRWTNEENHEPARTLDAAQKRMLRPEPALPVELEPLTPAPGDR